MSHWLPPRPRFRLVAGLKWKGFVEVRRAGERTVDIWFDAVGKGGLVYDSRTVTWERFEELVGKEGAALLRGDPRVKCEN